MEKWKPLVAIASLTTVFVVNTIFKGPDSSVTLAIVAAIAGLGGYIVGQKV